jgi:hypothetical protein
MPLPAGFKVNGSKVNTSRVPPRATKIIALVEKLPFGELLTTRELTGRMDMSDIDNHQSLQDYQELVDHRLFWGSRESIAQLRKQLAEPEESHDEN